MWINWTELDEPRACYTGWNKSGRGKQLLHINTYIWNLEKWYWWANLQGRNKGADVENGLMDTVGEGEGGTNWDSGIDKYTLSCVKQIIVESCHIITQGAQPGTLWQPRGVGYGDGGREAQKGGDIGWFALLYSRNQHNTIVKQLSSN